MISPLAPDALRKICPPESLPFEATDELKPLDEVVAQDRAVEAITFGVGIKCEGFNLFALGPAGSGKMTAIKRFLASEAAKLPTPPDWCYVNNFTDPQRPRALCLPPGRARILQADCERLLTELKTGVSRAFESEAYEQNRQAVLEELQKQTSDELEGLRKRADALGFGLAKTASGFMIVPMLRGKPLKPEGFEGLDEETKQLVNQRMEEVQKDLVATRRRVRDLEREAKNRLDGIDREVATSAVDHLIEEVKENYADHEAVQAHLEAIREDVIANVDLFRREQSGAQGQQDQTAMLRQGMDPFDRYRVNVLIEHGENGGAPVVVEAHPTCQNLLGRVEHQVQMGALYTNFLMAKAGALHRANGGFLVIEALELLKQFFAWDQLKRTLKNRRIRIEEPGEQFRLYSTVTLEPEPIPLNVKVVLIGNPWLYYLLHAYDPEFQELFKVQAEFSDRMTRTPETILTFARLLSTCCGAEGLRSFDRGAVAKLVEHSSRLVEDQDKLSTTFSHLLDVGREACFRAGQNGHQRVMAEDVQKAIAAKIRRANRVEELLQELVLDRTLLVDTEDAVVGQVNGIAVIQLGEYHFGKPSRITARTFLGRGGIVDIEREARMGGRIHSKGVLILSGYLGGRYVQQTPLALSASLAFEQVYEEVEGDSASSAELYAILSSLSGLPIKQGFAVTGSVNQQGEVQAIGAVNAKVEGFFDVCRARGLTGEQGVLIPASNVRHLMLREDVVEAVAAGQFHIYPIRTIDEGIALLTGREAGERGPDGSFPEGSANGLVQARLREMAEQAKAYGGETSAQSPSAADRHDDAES
ncbi:MAG: ATP-dependent protease [Candidatus Methylomirabilota bacterium]|nr:ATP-dependent protease [candidate division NC10 bacterium]PWB46219.1 MAG: ATP-dependent protease [candidate division NC10 bacterium]